MQNIDLIPEEKKKLIKHNFTSGEMLKKLKLTLTLTTGKFNLQNPAQYDSLRTREPILDTKTKTLQCFLTYLFTCLTLLTCFYVELHQLCTRYSFFFYR